VECDNCTLIHHGLDPNLDKSKRGREGVAIVLSNDATKAWNATGQYLMILVVVFWLFA